jgi:two-component system, NarL family, sensor histidine kinase BarA
MNNGSDQNNEPVIDRELGIKLAGNKPDLADEMLFMLVKTLPEEMQGLKHAKQQGDTVDLQKRLHKLHGAVCYCGVPRLKKIIATFETALKQSDTSNVCGFFKELENEIEQVLTQTSNLKA